jgi:glucose dehydrogenase
MQQPPATMTPGVSGNTGGATANPTPAGSDGMTGTVAGTGAQPAGMAGSNAQPMPMAGSDAANPGMAGGNAPNPGVSEWKMMGYDLGSTYNNTAERMLNRESAATLTEAYVVDMGGPVYGAPLQVGDKIYASSTSAVVAIDAASGKEVWRSPGGTSGSLAFDDGTLYLNTAANIVSINAADGKRMWMKRTHTTQTADGSSSPLVAGDVILIGGSNGGIELW